MIAPSRPNTQPTQRSPILCPSSWPADQLHKILSYIDIGQREGATLMCGGKQKGEAGYFVSCGGDEVPHQ